MSAPAVQPLLTAEEFVERYPDGRAELVRGRVVETPMPYPKHGKVCARVVRHVGNHAEDNDLGHVMSNDSFVRTVRGPDTVRGADVCFFGYERLPRGEVPAGLLPVVPDAAFEVLSPTDRWTVGSSRVDLQACKLEYSIVSPK